MSPRFLLTIRAGDRRIPLPVLLLFPLVLLLEVLAFVPLVVLSLWKRNALFSQIACRFYVSRLLLTLMLYGRRLRIRVQDGANRFSLG